MQEKLEKFLLRFSWPSAVATLFCGVEFFDVQERSKGKGKTIVELFCSAPTYVNLGSQVSKGGMQN